MSEKILKALMRLFAIIAATDESAHNARSVVESYLKQLLNNELVNEYLSVYDEYLKQHHEGAEGEKKKRRLAVSSVKVIVICEQINEELTQKQKFIVLINLIEFVNSGGSISVLESDFISIVSSSFNISGEELDHCMHLATAKELSALDVSVNVLMIGKKINVQNKFARYLESETIEGEIGVLRITSIGIYIFRYFGKTELFLNGQIITPGKIYILSPGSSIRSSKVLPIYYSEIVSRFLNDSTEGKITYDIKNITYKFKNGKTGLYPLSFSEQSGNLIGIMGGSGAGKSTLLNILNGNNSPSSGEVLINGYDLHKEKKKLEGVIGYIPQDDLLIEQLTVYQNLFYNTKLCFQGHSTEQIDKLVSDMLNDLGLFESKDLKVGNPLDKTISGGQRKRLNIALELIRRPSVLFVDEPTSGLSSRDSENIMDLLKGLALSGKLVFVVIHQPSSDIFKMFDKLLILDNGGYPIYYGYPIESVIWFKTIVNHINSNESECITCGNVNPEQVFNIIESKVLDENGNQTRNRRVTPKEWNDFYLEKIESDHLKISETQKQPVSITFRKPSFLHQFNVFISRDILSKISDIPYLAITLLEAPILALILSSLIKYYKNNGHDYLFSENKNMPAYLFMCVIVSLFVGLTVSAEEIFRDRKILKREAFLNLSRGSYLLTKMLILFSISAIQTISFVLIGNYIFGIHGMYFDYWMVLFTTSCFANMLGLNISSAFNTAVTIYILIPFLLIPQILLSGVIVKFEELNPNIASQAVVPIYGDMMASRWAFEALAVDQFMNNAYEKNIYAFDKEKSNSIYYRDYWNREMNSLASDVLGLQKKNPTSPEVSTKLQILKNEVLQQMHNIPSIPFASVEKLNVNDFNENIAKELKEYLANIKKIYSEKYNKASNDADAWAAPFQLNDKTKAQFLILDAENQNRKIEELVKNSSAVLESDVVEEDGKIVPTKDAIFHDGPSDRLIRAQFFAPRKNFFGTCYSTFWINIYVLWFMSLFMWITLYYDLLRKIISASESFFSKFRKKKK